MKLTKEEILFRLDLLIGDTTPEKDGIPDWDFFEVGNWKAMNDSLKKIKEWVNDVNETTKNKGTSKRRQYSLRA